MEWILGLIGSVILAFVTARITAKQDFAKLREQQKFDYRTEDAVLRLLENHEHDMRSFERIRHHMRGFETDDHLRRALIKSGAVAFDSDEHGEMWGLLSRNLDKVK